MDNSHYEGYLPVRRPDGGFKQSCSAYRVSEIDGAGINFKYGMPLNMRTGYKIYEN